MKPLLQALCTLDTARMTLPGRAIVPLFAVIPLLILINNEAAFTLPIPLSGAVSGDFGAADWGALQASVILPILPCLAVCLLLQKYCVSGLLAGAVK